MELGVFDIFQPGVGPSSSHTIGPMRAGKHFADTLVGTGFVPSSITVDLYGSLAATGIGHATDRAVLLGICGHSPETVAAEAVDQLIPTLQETGVLATPMGEVPFDYASDLCFRPRNTLPGHVNGLIITARASDGAEVSSTYYSTGGGFVSIEGDDGELIALDQADASDAGCEHHFDNAEQLLDICRDNNLSIAQVARRNELRKCSDQELDAHLDFVLATMFEAVLTGCTTEGTLPGGLRVPRRAPQLLAKLRSSGADPLAMLDWVSLYALAVNEENASGHRIVTAPTCGAAGVIPAVLGYLLVSKAAKFNGGHQALGENHRLWDLAGLLDAFEQLRPMARDFLLAAGAVGALIKTNASIAGAEVGCQGEVGSASAMAAAGLAQALGGTPAQVENAAEIALEHSLGLTCDPVGGLVQIPCIERNAIAATKAISAARMAMHGDGSHHVSLDVAIETMRQTGVDMNAKYKETSFGGLAVNMVAC